MKAETWVVPAAERDWVGLRVEVSAEVAEGVANLLLEEGALSVLAVPAASPAAGRERLEAALPASEHARVVRTLARYLASLAEIDPAARQVTLEADPIPPVDWTAVARRHHRRIAIGGRLVIAPPWDVPVASEREVLVIEPGMAFGTGQHATTRGCLEAIDSAVTLGGLLSALDVGTGSGVLALALARLGVARVVALDADPAVLPIAAANLRRNGATQVGLVAGTVAVIRDRFDLVVANLLAEPLMQEAAALAATVAPAGQLILSGLLTTQAPRVCAAYPAWRVASARAEDGWQTLTLVRRP